MGDVNPQESERIPLKPREIAQAITRGNSCIQVSSNRRMDDSFINGTANIATYITLEKMRYI